MSQEVPSKESPKWAKVARGEKISTGIEEIWKDPKKLQHFSAIAEAVTHVPSGSAGGPPDPAGFAERDAARRAVDKLNAHAQRLTDPKLKGAQEHPDFDTEEFLALSKIFYNYKSGAENLKYAEKKFDDKNLMATLHHISRTKGNEDIAGILAQAGNSAEDALPQVIKTLAFIDPVRFDKVMNAVAASEKILNRDRHVLERAQELASKHGLSYERIVQMLDRPDWNNELYHYVYERLQGTGSMLSNSMAAIRARGIVSRFAGVLRTRSVESYRGRDDARDERFTNIANSFRELLETPGVVRASLLRSVYSPDAPEESKTAHKKVMDARTEVGGKIEKKEEFKDSIEKFTADARHTADWANRADPATSERLAQSWLDQEYHSRLDGASGEGFWGGLWKLMASLLGNAYGRQQLQQVAGKIRSM